MKAIPTELAGVMVVQLDLFGDARGFFVERFQAERFAEHGLPSRFVQDNHSRSGPGVLRGLHYQTGPVQGKLVGVVRGRIWDVAVDLRAKSATFGRYTAHELSDVNGRLLWVPPGFGHGFCVLGDEPADVMYKVDSYYAPKGEGGVLWSDGELAIPWPVREPIVSQRDGALPTFGQFRDNPARWE